MSCLQAVIPAHRFKRHHWALTNMAARAIDTVRDGFPLSAALQTLTHSPAATLARASADGAVEAGAKQQHQLAHVPFAAMLAAEALAVYCLTRLTLSLVRHAPIYTLGLDISCHFCITLPQLSCTVPIQGQDNLKRTFQQ
jgi:hypothetical protein